MNTDEDPIDIEWVLFRIVFLDIFTVKCSINNKTKYSHPFRYFKDLVFETLVPQFNHTKTINKVSQIMYSISFCAMAFNN